MQLQENAVKFISSPLKVRSNPDSTPTGTGFIMRVI